jgi:hypothetical protein
MNFWGKEGYKGCDLEDGFWIILQEKQVSGKVVLYRRPI